MKLDPEMIRQLRAMSDSELWSTVRGIASSRGFTLPEAVPPHETMVSLRNTLSGADKLDLGTAVRILTQYRKSSKG